jgi:hypothetical protein
VFAVVRGRCRLASRLDIAVLRSVAILAVPVLGLAFLAGLAPTAAATTAT